MATTTQVSTGIPDRVVISADGTPIAVFSSGDGPPLLLVHGATADHTTWRTVGPLLAQSFRIHAIDRRGRGASGDGAGPYAIEREFEDVVAVAEALAVGTGRPTGVVGHSYGGRAVLGAALLSPLVGPLVVYEGAPSPPGTRQGYRPNGVEQRIRRLVASGDRDGALATFMREVVGMPDDDLAAFRADPIWPSRAAAVDTTIRELEGEASAAASLAALSRVTQPVLQILGGDSPAVFREATIALDTSLSDGRVEMIAGARHAAHHSHPEQFASVIQGFMTRHGVAD